MGVQVKVLCAYCPRKAKHLHDEQHLCPRCFRAAKRCKPGSRKRLIEEVQALADERGVTVAEVWTPHAKPKVREGTAGRTLWSVWNEHVRGLARVAV